MLLNCKQSVFVVFTMYWLSILCTSVYLTDSWAMLNTGRVRRPRCVDIPRNLSLCYGIDYDKMRLPNLLQHESMDEVVLQSKSWRPLIGLNCHPDTQLFLCSLFAPVCLNVDRPIPPCHSLCTAVQRGCESRMKFHGFPWPQMLDCAQFPTDTDMCIQPREKYVAKVKLSTINSNQCTVRVGTNLKQGVGHNHDHSHSNRERTQRSRNRRRIFRGQTVYYTHENRDCECPFMHDTNKMNPNKLRKQRYLLMANADSRGHVVATMLLPWKRNKQFKKAIRTFRKVDCRSLGRVIRDSARRQHSTAYPGPYTTRYDEPFY